MRWQTLMVTTAVLATSSVLAASHSDVFTVKFQSMPQVIQLDGVVAVVNQGTVAAQTSGRVIGVNVDINDQVEQGRVLLEISDVQQSASLQAAQAQLASAEAQNRDAQAQLQRYRQLFPKGAISRGQMDSAEAAAKSSAAAVKSATAAVAQAKESLDYTNITAPYAGVRAKPIMLTALAAMIGAMFILDDPIFNGLAISLIFGIFVSTILTLLVIPVLYYVAMRKVIMKKRVVN